MKDLLQNGSGGSICIKVASTTKLLEPVELPLEPSSKVKAAVVVTTTN